MEETCWMQVGVFAWGYKLNEMDKVWLASKGFLQRPVGITIYLGLVEETCWMQVAVFAQEYKLDETDKVWLVYKGFL